MKPEIPPQSTLLFVPGTSSVSLQQKTTSSKDGTDACPSDALTKERLSDAAQCAPGAIDKENVEMADLAD